MRVVLKSDVLVESLAALKEAGVREGRECIVLWLGRKVEGVLEVSEIFIPLQIAGEDFFHIPPEGMKLLMTRLKATRSMVIAQVHSHPGEAFHSEADDAWAIIRHEDALSLVVPRFGFETDQQDFWSHTKVYIFEASCGWTEMTSGQVNRTFEVKR